MTRRRKKSYWRPPGAAKQRTFEEDWRIAEVVAKGEEADRAMVARLHEASAEAAKRRNLGLALQAWKLASDELFPKKTQKNLAKRNMLQDLLVWIANAGTDGVTISYKSVHELKGYARSTLTDAIRTLARAKLIVKEKTHRYESFDGSQRDLGPNLYRVDWVGVAGRLAAASEGEAAPVAESSNDPRPARAGAETDDDSYAPAVEVRPESESPGSPDSGGYAGSRHTPADDRHTSATHTQQRPATHTRQSLIRDRDLGSSLPSPPVEPSATVAPAAGETYAAEAAVAKTH